MILLALPNRDLLLAQQLSRSVKRTIRYSPSIQQKLCFSPQTFSVRQDVQGEQVAPGRPQLIRVNQLVAPVFPWLFESVVHMDSNMSGDPVRLRNRGDHDLKLIESVQIKQSLESHIAAKTDIERIRLGTLVSPPLGTPISSSGTGRRFDVITRKGASWRRMVPMQPPLRFLRIVQSRSDQVGCEVKMRTLRGSGLKGSITMGQLYDICVDHTVPSQHLTVLMLDLIGSLEELPPSIWRRPRVIDAASKAMEGLNPDTGLLWTDWVRQCSRRDNEGADDYICEEEEGWLPPNPKSSKWKMLRSREAG